MHILDQQAPGVARRLRSLSVDQRRRIVARACELVSQSIGDLDRPLRELLGTIRSECALSAGDVEEARSLAEQADESYFSLKEEGAEESLWMRCFARARLLTGIAFAFGGENWKDAADGLYELFACREDATELLELVQFELDAAGAKKE